uniref:Uncharacterized protein n=1 Tax=Ditylenchus dipsaci TaxID=166011 RepID=A0A915DQ18_9BILA
MFHNREDSETFTLVKAYHLDVRLRLDFAKFMEGANQMYRGYEFRNMPKFLCTYHVYRPIFKRDISISFGHNLRNYMDRIEPMLFTLIREICGAFVVNIKENVALRTEEPNKPLNRIYQVYFQGWQIPISKMMCKTFLNDFLGQLGQAFDASKEKGGIGCGVTLETRVCD